MIHVIRHDMDPNSNINYCRKINIRFMLAIPQKRKTEDMLLILSNTPKSKHYNICLNPCLNIPGNKFSQNFMLNFM